MIFRMPVTPTTTWVRIGRLPTDTCASARIDCGAADARPTMEAVLVRSLVFGSLLATGCGFSVASSTTGDAQPRDGAVDAPLDALPATCTPQQTACDGRVRQVCGANMTWDPAQATTCDFTCASGACVQDSNVPLTAVATCGPLAPRFTPPAGATLTLTAAGGVHIDCAPNCGDAGVTRIDAAPTLGSAPGLSWFCVAAISIPAGVTLGRPSSGGPAQSIAFVSDGNVVIDGTIDFDGQAATQAVPGGRGAPGGFDGADLSAGSGNDGHGPCPGRGGQNDGSSNHWIGGGGGGGGHVTDGAPGGEGRCSNGSHTAAGDVGGGTCGTATLIPLVGGSGGGSGGDGTTNVQQGWAAGGGGGALQISSRTKIAITGAIHASGGAGYGNSAFDGGGGGGAGGAVLLEAPVVAITGGVIVDGGSGGRSGAGLGGAGATGANGPETGRTHMADGQGGSGGGGAGGRIRLNAISAACPSTASPAMACVTGTMPPQ